MKSAYPLQFRLKVKFLLFQSPPNLGHSNTRAFTNKSQGLSFDQKTDKGKERPFSFTMKTLLLQKPHGENFKQNKLQQVNIELRNFIYQSYIKYIFYVSLEGRLQIFPQYSRELVDDWY